MDESEKRNPKVRTAGVDRLPVVRWLSEKDRGRRIGWQTTAKTFGTDAKGKEKKKKERKPTIQIESSGGPKGEPWC